MEKYSKELFDALFKKVQNGLSASENSLPFKGLWAFSYLEGANALQSVYFNHVDKESLYAKYQIVIEEIETTRLDCDYGSLGFSFRNLKNDPNKIVEFLPNTFNDAKGTVCYYDTVINQQHACFVIIRNENEILGVLDFFFAGNTDNNKEETIKKYFINNKSELISAFINAFKIQEFEYFLEIQSEKREIHISEDTSFKADLQFAIEHIEQVIAMSSKTPLMIINRHNDNITPALVCLNFDFIHSIIKHEHRFCPLTNDNKNCFYFKDFESFSSNNADLKCDNNFLNNYYYKVFTALDANLLCQKIIVDGTEYELEVVSQNTSTVSLESNISVIGEICNLSYEGLDDLAKEKYRDERVFMQIEECIKSHEDIYAFSLSRKVKPFIKCNINCNGIETDCQCRNTYIENFPLKQFISPSNTLPVQYENMENGLFIKNESAYSNNIIHFKIVKEGIFTDALKGLIAKKPEYYIETIKSYLNNETSKTYYDQLSLTYAGTNPIDKRNKYAEIIKGKLNLIETLLQGEEIKHHARKAAIAQVMLRNMSHNHGSHVLANLTQPQTILDMFFVNSHDDLMHNEKSLADGNKLTFKNSDGKEIKVNSKPTSFNVAIAELSSYMRTRMDFLADISTGTAVIETNKKLSNDVVEPFQERAVLLKKYITGNEKKVRINNPNESIVAAFPNDNLGVQAFYVIIENVIRNSAKHSKSNKDVDIYWKSDANTYNGLTELIIYDKNDQKASYELECLVIEQNERIQKDMLDNGVLRHGSWGMLEMKIAAAYLRKVPVEKIDETFITPLLTAVSVPEKNGNYLGYKFYLLKPKQVLTIINTNSDDIKVNEECGMHGIKFISLFDLCQSEETFGHDIVLLAGCNESDIYGVRKRLSARIINTDLETLKTKINGQYQTTDFINWAWEEWFKKLIWKTNPVTVFKIDDTNGNTPNKVELSTKSQKNSTEAEFVYHCKTFREDSGYFEPYGSLHPANKQIGELTNSSLFDLKVRFLETINYTVAIADERIQKHTDAKFDGGIISCTKRHADFLEKCGVILPPMEIDLNAKSFESKIEGNENGKAIKQQLNEWCQEQAKKCNFLVIHIGLIERLLELDTVKDENKQKKIEEYLSYLRKTQGRKARFIITSGRGQPESLPKGERFIHYSNIAQYVIEKRSKFHLIQLLMSARETK